MTDQDKNSTDTEEKTESVRDAVAAAAAEIEMEAPEAPEAEPTTELTAETAEDAAPDEVETQEETEAAPDPVNRPEWWAEDRNGLWTALDREAQDYLVARDRERTEAIEKDRIDPAVRGVLAQIEQNAQLYGATTEQALGRLFNAHRLLETNPRHALTEIARQYGIDLSQVAPSDGQNEQADDPVQQIRDVVTETVQQQLGQFQHNQQQREVGRSLSELERWSKETDSDGKLLRPHFEDLQYLVHAQLQQIQSQEPNGEPWEQLDRAYKAVERVKAPSEQERIDAAVKAALQARDNEAEKADKAAISPKAPASGTKTVANGSAGSVMDDVRASYQQLTGSGRI